MKEKFEDPMIRIEKEIVSIIATSGCGGETIGEHQTKPDELPALP